MIYHWIENIEFANPWAFLGLILIPILLFFYLKKSKKGFLYSTKLNKLPQTFTANLRHILFILRLISIGLLVTCCTQPQITHFNKQTKGNGIDIMLCMDVSGSMGAKDIAPSRLEAAKEVAISFVKKRPVDKMGLVIFSGESFTKCPLTPDKNVLIQQIKSLRERNGGFLEPGTVIGEGLAMSVTKILSGTAKSKVVILLTDGKEEPPYTRIIDPETALQMAKENNVKVYSIGMGGGAEASGEGIAPDGGKIKNFIDEELLQHISIVTGGKYFRATDKATLETIYSRIDQLEKSKIETITHTVQEPKFLPFLLLALFILLIEQILQYTFFRSIF